MYYAPTVFLSLGFPSDAAAVLGSVGLGVVKVRGILYRNRVQVEHDFLQNTHNWRLYITHECTLSGIFYEF